MIKFKNIKNLKVTPIKEGTNNQNLYKINFDALFKDGELVKKEYSGSFEYSKCLLEFDDKDETFNFQPLFTLENIESLFTVKNIKEVE